MNKLILILIVIAVAPTWAKSPKKFLVCLGKEEAYIHKHKLGGAYSKLNQEMISVLVQLSDSVKMLPQEEKLICKKRFSSVELLKLLITSKGMIFFTEQRAEAKSQRAIDKMSIKALHDQGPFIFLDFINSLQAQMPNSKCLTKQIPELASFFDKLQHTLEEAGINNILKELKNLDRIFYKLQHLKTDKKSC